MNVIFGDPMGGAWLDVTEQAKTLTILESMLPNVFNPKYQYSFNVSMLPIETAVRVSYLPAYISKQPKKWVGCQPGQHTGTEHVGRDDRDRQVPWG